MIMITIKVFNNYNIINSLIKDNQKERKSKKIQYNSIVN